MQKAKGSIKQCSIFAKHGMGDSDNEDEEDDEVMPMTKIMMLMRTMGMNMSRIMKGTTLMMQYDNVSNDDHQ